MPKVFIAHVSSDRYFVDLLAELLQYHHIEVRREADDQPEADYLLVVGSKYSRGSAALEQAISSFQIGKGRANIVPILLDDTTPEQISASLRGIKGISFHASMLDGFRSLLKTFGKDFLPDPNKRSGNDRRASDRRSMDRRKSPVAQRLRYGLWKLYEGETGCGKFDVSYLTLGERLKAIDVLQKELQKYECFTRDGSSYRPSKMELDKLTSDVWQELGRQGYLTAVIMIEALADRVMKQYELRPIDRRSDDRRTGFDRREPLFQSAN
jgi:hypothetical protein